MSSGLLPHQQRVVEEKQELDAKIARLKVFMFSGQFAQVSLAEARLMLDQMGHMLRYSQVLGDRIQLFGGQR